MLIVYSIAQLLPTLLLIMSQAIYAICWWRNIAAYSGKIEWIRNFLCSLCSLGRHNALNASVAKNPSL